MGNERFVGVLDGRPSGSARLPFLCECADEACNGRVEIKRRQWEAIAAEPRRYVMVAGHPRSEGEEVVAALDGYDVVLKPL